MPLGTVLLFSYSLSSPHRLLLSLLSLLSRLSTYFCFFVFAFFFRARELSLDSTTDSPFALLAKENDIMWGGGMPDDITVVALRVINKADSPSAVRRFCRPCVARGRFGRSNVTCVLYSRISCDIRRWIRKKATRSRKGSLLFFGNCDARANPNRLSRWLLLLLFLLLFLSLLLLMLFLF